LKVSKYCDRRSRWLNIGMLFSTTFNTFRLMSILQHFPYMILLSKCIVHICYSISILPQRYSHHLKSFVPVVATLPRAPHLSNYLSICTSSIICNTSKRYQGVLYRSEFIWMSYSLSVDFFLTYFSMYSVHR